MPQTVIHYMDVNLKKIYDVIYLYVILVTSLFFDETKYCRLQEYLDSGIAKHFVGAFYMNMDLIKI